MAYNYSDIVFALKGLTPTVKLVLLHLAEHADKDTGECWPGFGRLADFTGLTRRSIIYSINCLEKMEFVTITPPTTRKTNTYVLHMDKLVAWSLAPVAKKAKRPYVRTGKYAGKNRKVKQQTEVNVTPTADDVDHLYTTSANKGHSCKTCGVPVGRNSDRVAHIKDEHPKLWDEVIQTLIWREEEIELLNESQLQPAFNIEGDDDDDLV